MANYGQLFEKVKEGIVIERIWSNYSIYKEAMFRELKRENYDSGESFFADLNDAFAFIANVAQLIEGMNLDAKSKSSYREKIREDKEKLKELENKVKRAEGYGLFFSKEF